MYVEKDRHVFHLLHYGSGSFPSVCTICRTIWSRAWKKAAMKACQHVLRKVYTSEPRHVIETCTTVEGMLGSAIRLQYAGVVRMKS